VSDSAVALFTARTNSPGTRALGWDTCGHDGSCGKYLSEKSYGHTGYTGTSLWIDPEREMFVVLLTNRVHAARARRPSKVIADVRADVADAAALAVRDYGDGLLAMPRSFRADRAVGWNRPVRSRGARSRSRAKSTKTAKVRPAKQQKAAKSSGATGSR
jgi:CubicO group peptidase (beta-lactamase class C family)